MSLRAEQKLRELNEEQARKQVSEAKADEGAKENDKATD